MRIVLTVILATLVSAVAAASHLEPLLADLRADLTPEERTWLSWALQLEEVDAADLADRERYGLWVETTGEVVEVLAYTIGDPEPEIHLRGGAICWPVGDYWEVVQVGDRLTVRAWLTTALDLEDCLLASPDIALLQFDDNRNGQITCAEAREHGIAPVTREHPAYRFMRDGDGDGVVCE